MDPRAVEDLLGLETMKGRTTCKHTVLTKPKSVMNRTFE